MGIFKMIKLKLWRTLAMRKHRYTAKYARMLGVKVADNVRFTGVPDFSTEPWLVEIGERCLITQNVRFMTHDGSVNMVHRLGEEYKHILKFGKIIVDNDVFIGANTMVMPNVHIGAFSIIAACSCVTKDVPSGEVWGGVPAKRICSIKEYADRLNSISSDYNDRLTPSMSKKECSTIVAEAYWDNRRR